MQFYSIIFIIFSLYVPTYIAFPSFLQLKLQNPTQSQNGGGDQMYERNQQAAEHIFLPFSHKMSFFEHQNPYVVYPKVQDELKEKKKENEKNKKDHDIYQNSIKESLKNSMSDMSQKINTSKLNEIYEGEDIFKFKLNPQIGTKSENDSMISDILKQSEALSQENDNSKSGKVMSYAATELNKTLEHIEENSDLKVGDQLSVYENINKEESKPTENTNEENMNLSKEFLNQNVMTEKVSELDTSENVPLEKEDNKLDLLKNIIENRTKTMENEANSYTGTQSLFVGNKIFTDFKNKTYYNGWINNPEVPYFDHLYLDGYYNDIIEK